jgi:uncharacterized Fe-S cluster-containing radical SAM superfamily protein
MTLKKGMICRVEQGMDPAVQFHKSAVKSRRSDPSAECGASTQVDGDSIFFREWLASGQPSNQLPISAVCNSHCLFCSNNLNPFPISRGLFRDVEDIKLQLSLMSSGIRHPIRMSDCTPGRIAEGEAFLHPEFFKILSLVRRKFPVNRLCFTTNGTMLDESFVKELSRYKPIEITLSIHSTHPDLWARICGKPPTSAKKAIGALDLLRQYKIDFAGSIVPLPGVCGWEDIERTFATFVSRGAQAMILWWPGYSVCSTPDAVSQMDYPLAEFLRFAERMHARHGKPITAYPHVSAGLALEVDRILSATRKGNVKNSLGSYRRVLWLTSEAAHGKIKGAIDRSADDEGNGHIAYPVRNGTYGGNIIVAGLLMVEDFVRAGKEALSEYPEAELVLVPKAPFDAHGRDLTGNPAYRIAEELQRPVWVLSDRGDVDRLLERAFERKEDTPAAPVKQVMERFNLAWQDATRIDASLDLIDAFPVKTPWGLLTREELRDAILRSKEGFSDGAVPITQASRLLDNVHALCSERQQGREGSVLRWTFLLKRKGGWRIGYISQNAAEDAPCG